MSYTIRYEGDSPHLLAHYIRQVIADESDGEPWHVEITYQALDGDRIVDRVIEGVVLRIQAPTGPGDTIVGPGDTVVGPGDTVVVQPHTYGTREHYDPQPVGEPETVSLDDITRFVIP